jgi:hypothetical protein
MKYFNVLFFCIFLISFSINAQIDTTTVNGWRPNGIDSLITYFHTQGTSDHYHGNFAQVFSFSGFSNGYIEIEKTIPPVSRTPNALNLFIDTKLIALSPSATTGSNLYVANYNNHWSKCPGWYATSSALNIWWAYLTGEDTGFTQTISKLKIRFSLNYSQVGQTADVSIILDWYTTWNIQGYHESILDDFELVTKITEENENVKDFQLSQNYPNPFNPKTVIEFYLPKKSFTKLIVYDLLGREIDVIVNKELQSGSYKVNFNGSNFTNGMYYYRLQAGDFVQVNKMVLLK